MRQYKSTGILIFDPTTRQTKHYRDWWVILSCDDEIAAYYRYWIQRELDITLQRNLWGSHISIIRGEKPKKNTECWKKDHKTKVSFSYTPEALQHNDTHWWLKIFDIESLSTIREFYGLSERPAISFHLTIGRTMPL